MIQNLYKEPLTPDSHLQRQRHTATEGEESSQILGHGRQETSDVAEEAERATHPSDRGSQHVQGRRECDSLRRSKR